MIEKLKNCPNCGGTLNEAGRCSFCGSKVYDFLSINFDHTYRPSAKTYIRIRSNGKVILAPVIVGGVNIKFPNDILYCDSISGESGYIQHRSYPNYNVDFIGIGEAIMIDKGDTD